MSIIDFKALLLFTLSGTPIHICTIMQLHYAGRVAQTHLQNEFKTFWLHFFIFHLSFYTLKRLLKLMLKNPMIHFVSETQHRWELGQYNIRKLTQSRYRYTSKQMHTRACAHKNTHSQSQSSKHYQQTHFELLHMLSKSIQLSFVLETCFLSPIKIEMYFYMPNTQRQNVQWQHSVWGMREVFVPANKYVHAIFCSSKIRYLGQGVRSFLVGLSGESCFVLRLRSEINEKPFDFPSKERVQAGRNCELCWGECRMPPMERKREKSGKH